MKRVNNRVMGWSEQRIERQVFSKVDILVRSNVNDKVWGNVNDWTERGLSRKIERLL